MNGGCFFACAERENRHLLKRIENPLGICYNIAHKYAAAYMAGIERGMRQTVKQNSKRIITACIVVLLLFAAMMLRVVTREHYDSIAVPVLRNAIHIGLLTAWGISVRSRVMQPQALKLLMTAAWLMLFWFVIRLLKYEFVENTVVSRYLWYLYYLPMLFIPLCALLTAMLLGKSELARLPKYAVALKIISAVLFLLVMTNDLHQHVFRFPLGKPWSDKDYGYGPAYYSIVVWLLICALSFLVLLLCKCRIPKSRKFVWLPGVSVLLLIAYTVLYLCRVRWLFELFGDMTATFCLCYIAILESCMQTGLIQTNTGYDMLFEVAAIKAQITDENWNTRYRSGDSDLDAETLSKAESAPVLLNRNTLLKTSRIGGGHVAWQEDVAELAGMIEQLEENQRELEDENFLEREALRAKQEVLRLQEKNRLYDLIGRFTRPQIEHLDALLKEYERTEGENARRRLLSKICVIGAYVKRCGNLLLIREGGKTAPVSELVKAMEESMQNLELTDAECGLSCMVEREISTAAMVKAYAFFERVIETAADRLDYLWSNLRLKGSELILRMELETKADLSDLAGDAELGAEDGVWSVTVRYDAGGDAQ